MIESQKSILSFATDLEAARGPVQAVSVALSGFSKPSQVHLPQYLRAKVFVHTEVPGQTFPSNDEAVVAVDPSHVHLEPKDVCRGLLAALHRILPHGGDNDAALRARPVNLGEGIPRRL